MSSTRLLIVISYLDKSAPSFHPYPSLERLIFPPSLSSSPIFQISMIIVVMVSDYHGCLAEINIAPFLILTPSFPSSEYLICPLFSIAPSFSRYVYHITLSIVPSLCQPHIAPSSECLIRPPFAIAPLSRYVFYTVLSCLPSECLLRHSFIIASFSRYVFY